MIVKSEKIKLVRLTQAHSQGAFELVCDEFSQSSPIHLALGITADEYRQYLAQDWDRIVDEGLSLVALDVDADIDIDDVDVDIDDVDVDVTAGKRASANAVLGCLLATDYSSLNEAPVASQQATSLAKMLPIKALLRDLEALYATIAKRSPGRRMLVDLAIVSEGARGRGLYSSLRKASHQLGAQEGYDYVIGELSSAITQTVCVDKFGHTIQAEIAYSSYQYDGDLPFSTIKSPNAIKLVEGHLGKHQAVEK